MLIIHKIDDFLYSLFPNVIEGDIDTLLLHLTDYYTYGPYKPKVTVSEGVVTVELDTPSIHFQDPQYRKAVDHCEKGRFPEAKAILRSLIQITPSVSEYHRVLGQALSIEGDQEEAINCLIDALRWDSRNGFALVMLGNIFGRFKNDMPTAMKYYDQAVTINPNDSIALNNIGAFLLEGRKYQEAKKYFLQALTIDPKYPNIHHALGIIARMEGDLPSAFSSAIASVKFNNDRNELFNKSVNQAYELAEEMIQSPVGMSIVTEYLHKLEFEGGVEIDILPDAAIQTSAKFELAENYSRPKHTVRYKPGQPAHEHLIMHELVHLDLMYQARAENQNQVFVSNPGNVISSSLTSSPPSPSSVNVASPKTKLPISSLVFSMA